MPRAPRDAYDFHEADPLDPVVYPPGWSWQTWEMTDQCCGNKQPVIMLPDDWSARIELELERAPIVAATYRITGVNFKSKGEDGNSHLCYVESGIILSQMLCDSENEEWLAVNLVVTLNGYEYTVITMDDEYFFPTLEEAMQEFQRRQGKEAA